MVQGYLRLASVWPNINVDFCYEYAVGKIIRAAQEKIFEWSDSILLTSTDIDFLIHKAGQIISK